MAGEPGFEPGLTESESVGLPLTYSPVPRTTAENAASSSARYPDIRLSMTRYKIAICAASFPASALFKFGSCAASCAADVPCFDPWLVRRHRAALYRLNQAVRVALMGILALGLTEARRMQKTRKRRWPHGLKCRLKPDQAGIVCQDWAPRS